MKKALNEKGITLIILVLTMIVILIITSITVPNITQKITQINEKKAKSYQNEIVEDIKYDIEQARKNGIIQGREIPLNVLENILVKYSGEIIEEDSTLYIVLNNDIEAKIPYNSIID